MTSLSLIIPCYNEEKTLETCVARCMELCKHPEFESLSLELIIVDDYSSDNSYAIAQKLQEQYPHMISLYKHEINRGKGAALRTGLINAKGDMVGIQDADEEYNPLDYINLMQPILENKADVVYGSRYLRQETRRVLYFWHTWMNRSLTFISNMFTNLDISDMETCYKLFRRETIQAIAPNLKEDRFGFEPEVTALIAQSKARVYEHAISYTPRTYEEGKKIGWRDGVRALYCILHYSAHCAPLPMQILLYTFIGFCAAIVNIVAFTTFISMESSITSATLMAFSVAAVVNYILCIFILFRHKARWSTKGELIAYALTVIVMAGVDLGITSGFHALGMGLYASKLLGIIIGFVGNFSLRKYFVF